MRVGSAFVCATTMANSRFQYVKKFELPDALMQDTYLITRLDGHRFTKFTAEHGFSKPNDERGLLLMTEVMSEWTDLVMAYGQSDEFSFLLPASSSLYGRRSAKIATSFVSLFSSSFVFFWSKYFPDTPLLYPPNFDARVVSYPSAEHIRDYFGWRQADCHINNLYNTCFWSLVAAGESKQDAQVILKGTTSGDKNELLFSRFGINYNEIPQRFRKGTTLYRTRPGASTVPPPQPPFPSVAPSTRELDANSAKQDNSDQRNDAGQRLETGRPPTFTREPAEPDGNKSVGRQDRESMRQGGGESVNCEPGERGADMSVPTEIDGIDVMHLPDASATMTPAVTGVADGQGGPEPNACASLEHRQETGPTEKSNTCHETDEKSGASGHGVVSSESKKMAGSSQDSPRLISVSVDKSTPGDGGGMLKAAGGSGAPGKGRRLLKKGHAPPGVVEEDVCDIIRDNFWIRNPHILAGVERRR